MTIIEWVFVCLSILTIGVCLYTLWKIRFIATNTVDNRRDINALHEHDRKLLGYFKQLNGEFQNVKKSWAKTEKRSKQSTD